MVLDVKGVHGSIFNGKNKEVRFHFILQIDNTSISYIWQQNKTKSRKL